MKCKVTYEEKDGVAYIFFDRPEKRNALTKEMWLCLADYLSRACGSSVVRVVVLRGRGGAFSAGDDIGEMLGLTSSEEAREFFRAPARAFMELLRCRKPVIAVVEGPAVGGGAEMLLAADLVIASRDSVIGFPESRLGLIPPVLATLGVYILGLRRAKALALSGAMLGASEAQEAGIVDLVADPDAVDGVLEEMIALMKRTPPEAVEAVKRIAMASVAPALEAAMAELALLSLTSEAKERMRRFLESRRA